MPSTLFALIRLFPFLLPAKKEKERRKEEQSQWKNALY